MSFVSNVKNIAYILYCARCSSGVQRSAQDAYSAKVMMDCPERAELLDPVISVLSEVSFVAAEGELSPRETVQKIQRFWQQDAHQLVQAAYLRGCFYSALLATGGLVFMIPSFKKNGLTPILFVGSLLTITPFLYRTTVYCLSIFSSNRSTAERVESYESYIGVIRFFSFQFLYSHSSLMQGEIGARAKAALRVAGISFLLLWGIPYALKQKEKLDGWYAKQIRNDPNMSKEMKDFFCQFYEKAPRSHDDLNWLLTTLKQLQQEKKPVALAEAWEERTRIQNEYAKIEKQAKEALTKDSYSWFSLYLNKMKHEALQIQVAGSSINPAPSTISKHMKINAD